MKIAFEPRVKVQSLARMLRIPPDISVPGQAGEVAAELAAGDGNVLGGACDADAFHPSAGLERDRIVTGVDVTILDLHIA